MDGDDPTPDGVPKPKLPVSVDDLYRSHYPSIYKLVFRMLRNREDAEDATQEIFIKAWQSRSAFRGEARIETWLHPIALRHCLNLIRDRHPADVHYMAECDGETGEGVGSDGGRPVEMRSTSADFHYQDERWLTSREALDRLSESLKVTFLLHYYSGYECAEIAGILAIPVETVKSRLKISRRLLKEALLRSQAIDPTEP